MVAQVLREAFALAHRRPGLILLDMLWKVVWLAFTVGGLLLVGYWFASQIPWQSWRIDLLALRQLWNEYGSHMFGPFFSLLGILVVTWVVLEALFRKRLVVAGFSPRPDFERGLKPATTSLTVLIASNLAKITILATAAVFLGVITVQSPYASVAAFVGFAALAFLLTVLDTLIRVDAVFLLGTNLIDVAGLIFVLLFFEAMIGASLTVVLIAGFLNVSRPSEGLAMIAVTTLVLLFYNFLHSYLLVVRYSAVGIMRRNVVEV